MQSQQIQCFVGTSSSILRLVNFVKIKTHGSESCGQVKQNAHHYHELFTQTTNSYRILVCYVLAPKNCYLKITALYKSAFHTCYVRVNNRQQSLVMPYDILVRLSYSSPPPPSPSPLHTHQHNQLHVAIIFETYVFGCVSVRAVELLTQVLWLLKFLQTKSWCSHLHVRSAITRFSQSFESFVFVSHGTIFDV